MNNSIATVLLILFLIAYFAIKKVRPQYTLSLTLIITFIYYIILNILYISLN